MRYIKESGVEVVIYEPTLTTNVFDGYKVINDLNSFKTISDVVVVNRMNDEVKDIMDKVYTRDLYERD